MFRVDNELKKANVPRTVRFTEPLFEKLNEVAGKNDVSFTIWFYNVANMRWIIWKKKNNSRTQKVCLTKAKSEADLLI